MSLSREETEETGFGNGGVIAAGGGETRVETRLCDAMRCYAMLCGAAGGCFFRSSAAVLREGEF